MPLHRKKYLGTVRATRQFHSGSRKDGTVPEEPISSLKLCQCMHKRICAGRRETWCENRFYILVFFSSVIDPADCIFRGNSSTFFLKFSSSVAIHVDLADIGSETCVFQRSIRSSVAFTCRVANMQARVVELFWRSSAKIGIRPSWHRKDLCTGLLQER